MPDGGLHGAAGRSLDDQLEGKCVVIRTVAPSSPPSVEYTLSDLGKELIPVIDTIVRVGTRLIQEARRAARAGTATRRA